MSLALFFANFKLSSSMIEFDDSPPAPLEELRTSFLFLTITYATSGMNITINICPLEILAVINMHLSTTYYNYNHLPNYQRKLRVYTTLCQLHRSTSLELDLMVTSTTGPQLPFSGCGSISSITHQVVLSHDLL